MSKIVWRCDISEEMISHLNEEQRNTFLEELSQIVNRLGKLYKVGREYENGELKENNYA